MRSNPTILIATPDNEKKSGYETPEITSDKHTVIEDSGATNQSVPNQSIRKLVGFLVSYSRFETGEYWPLFLGKNEIGSSLESNVALREHKVSGNHSIINIRRVTIQKTGEIKLVFVINDCSSTNGTIVNGEDLVFENGQRILSQNDMIGIGNYHLMLICIDTLALDLNTNPEFSSLDDNTIDDSYDYDQREPNSTRVQQ